MSKISFTLKLGYKLFNIKSICTKTKSSYFYIVSRQEETRFKNQNGGPNSAHHLIYSKHAL